MNTPEQMWERFMDHLKEVDPLAKPDPKNKDFKQPRHQSFLGSVTSYRAIFLAANKDDPAAP
jgi:hypothetical protein